MLMSSFETTVRAVALPHVGKEDIDGALAQVGPQAAQEVDRLDRAERATMADRFVRNLRALSVHEQVKLERQLLLRLDAVPSSIWASQLDSAVSLIELRNHLKQALTVLGLDWGRTTRVQSLVGGVARWLQSMGSASMRVTSSDDAVSFVLSTRAPALTPELVRESPMVQMMRDQVAQTEVRKNFDAVEIAFSIHRPQ